MTPRLHGECVHGVETGTEGAGSEPGPTAVDLIEVDVDHGLPAAVTVRAWTLIRLLLEDLQDAHCVTRRSRASKLAVRRAQHDPRSGHVEDLDATLGDHREEIDHVEIIDQHVGQLDEGTDQKFLLSHRYSSRFWVDGRSQRVVVLLGVQSFFVRFPGPVGTSVRS